MSRQEFTPNEAAKPWPNRRSQISKRFITHAYLQDGAGQGFGTSQIAESVRLIQLVKAETDRWCCERQMSRLTNIESRPFPASHQSLQLFMKDELLQPEVSRALKLVVTDFWGDRLVMLSIWARKETMRRRKVR